MGLNGERLCQVRGVRPVSWTEQIYREFVNARIL